MNSKRENLLRTGIVASNHRTRANVLKKRGFFSLSYHSLTKPNSKPPCMDLRSKVASGHFKSWKADSERNREREHHASIFQMWKPKKAQGFSEAVNKKDGKEKRPSLEKYNDTQLSIKKLREALLSSRSLLGVRDFIS